MIQITRWVLFVFPWLLMAALVGWHFGAPVVIWASADNWHITPTSISAHISGRKIRNCQFIDGAQSGYVEVAGVWAKTGFHFRSDPAPGTSRPTGLQSFGIWEWSWDYGTSPTRVMLRVRHICGMTEVDTTQGPFDVPVTP